DLVGFDVIPTDHLAQMMKKVPLKVGAPRDRQLVVTTHEMAVNELKDHGFPYAKVATAEDDGPEGKHAKMTFTAEPGKSANFGSVRTLQRREPRGRPPGGRAGSRCARTVAGAGSRRARIFHPAVFCRATLWIRCGRAGLTDVRDGVQLHGCRRRGDGDTPENPG